MPVRGVEAAIIDETAARPPLWIDVSRQFTHWLIEHCLSSPSRPTNPASCFSSG
jgi:hypothetical protein